VSCNFYIWFLIFFRFTFIFATRSGKRKKHKTSCKDFFLPSWRWRYVHVTLFLSSCSLSLLVLWWYRGRWVPFEEEMRWEMKPVIQLQVSCWSLLYPSNKKRSMFRKGIHKIKPPKGSHVNADTRSWIRILLETRAGMTAL
jgi:hypothetical protein